MTSLRPIVVLLVLASALLAGCSESHPPTDARDAGPPSDAPLSCDLRSTDVDGLQLVLEPEPGNPASCTTPAPCEVWFGHGQHLRCPRYLGPPSPIDAACDIYDCVCDDEMGFVANFATTEVIDARAGVECRYRIVFE